MLSKKENYYYFSILLHFWSFTRLYFGRLLCSRLLVLRKFYSALAISDFETATCLLPMMQIAGCFRRSQVVQRLLQQLVPRNDWSRKTTNSYLLCGLSPNVVELFHHSKCWFCSLLATLRTAGRCALSGGTPACSRRSAPHFSAEISLPWTSRNTSSTVEAISKFLECFS